VVCCGATHAELVVRCGAVWCVGCGCGVLRGFRCECRVLRGCSVVWCGVVWCGEMVVEEAWCVVVLRDVL
jgi:hypothetical protein